MDEPQDSTRYAPITIQPKPASPAADTRARHYAEENIYHALMDPKLNIEPVMANHNIRCRRLGDDRGKRAICGGDCEYFSVMDYGKDEPRTIPLVDACRMLARGEYERLLTPEQKDLILELFRQDRAASK
jgi:hypothetical protein